MDIPPSPSPSHVEVHRYKLYWKGPLNTGLVSCLVETANAYKPEHYEDYLKLAQEETIFKPTNVFVRVK